MFSATNSIRTRVTLLVLILLAVIFALSGGFIYWDNYTIAMKEAKGKATAISKIIAGIGSYTFLTSDYTILDEAIQKAMDQQEVLYVKIYDKMGNIQRESKKEEIHADFIEVKEPIVVSEEEAGYVLFGLSTQETLTSLKKSIVITVFQVIAGLIISSALLIYVLNKLITNRISLLNRAALKISEGDLTHAIEVHGTDEISSLGAAINAMASNLKNMLFKIQSISNVITNVTANLSSSSLKVQGSAQIQQKAIQETSGAVSAMNHAISAVVENEDSLSSLAIETSSSVMEMNASTQAIAENASVFYEASQETASSIEEMISSIKQIAENLDNLSAFAAETSSAITELSASVKEVKASANESVSLAEKVHTDITEEGLSSIHAALGGIDDIRFAVNSLSDVINRLRKRSEDIGKILTVIDTVADQTTLLAINAAILASKAGEHGRGFSVVANEIKDLAERTTVSTGEIAKLIFSVQEETQSSVDMTEKGLDSVERGARLFGNVTLALNRILESSTTSTEMARVIQRATEQESQVINQITKSIRSMVDQINQIATATTEQKKGSTFIIEATEKMKDVSLQVKTATKDQSDGSRQITGAIENQNFRIEQIRESTNNQKIKSADIVKAVTSISKTTEELIKSSSALDSEISTLTLETKNLLSALEKFKA